MVIEGVETRKIIGIILASVFGGLALGAVAGGIGAGIEAWARTDAEIESEMTGNSSAWAAQETSCYDQYGTSCSAAAAAGKSGAKDAVATQNSLKGKNDKLREELAANGHTVSYNPASGTTTVDGSVPDAFSSGYSNNPSNSTYDENGNVNGGGGNDWRAGAAYSAAVANNVVTSNNGAGGYITTYGRTVDWKCDARGQCTAYDANGKLMLRDEYGGIIYPGDANGQVNPLTSYTVGSGYSYGCYSYDTSANGGKGAVLDYTGCAKRDDGSHATVYDGLAVDTKIRQIQTLAMMIYNGSMTSVADLDKYSAEMFRLGMSLKGQYYVINGVAYQIGSFTGGVPVVDGKYSTKGVYASFLVEGSDGASAWFDMAGSSGKENAHSMPFVGSVAETQSQLAGLMMDIEAYQQELQDCKNGTSKKTAEQCKAVEKALMAAATAAQGYIDASGKFVSLTDKRLDDANPCVNIYNRAAEKTCNEMNGAFNSANGLKLQYLLDKCGTDTACMEEILGESFEDFLKNYAALVASGAFGTYYKGFVVGAGALGIKNVNGIDLAGGQYGCVNCIVLNDGGKYGIYFVVENGVPRIIFDSSSIDPFALAVIDYQSDVSDYFRGMMPEGIPYSMPGNCGGMLIKRGDQVYDDKGNPVDAGKAIAECMLSGDGSGYNGAPTGYGQNGNNASSSFLLDGLNESAAIIGFCIFGGLDADDNVPCDDYLAQYYAAYGASMGFGNTSIAVGDITYGNGYVNYGALVYSSDGFTAGDYQPQAFYDPAQYEQALTGRYICNDGAVMDFNGDGTYTASNGSNSVSGNYGVYMSDAGVPMLQRDVEDYSGPAFGSGDYTYEEGGMTMTGASLSLSNPVGSAGIKPTYCARLMPPITTPVVPKQTK
jgi:hypothetical protein